MKKLTALFLTLVVALSLSVTALAANSSDNDAIIQQAIDLLIEGKSGEAESLILSQVSNLVIQNKRDEAQALLDGYKAAKAAAADEIAAAAAVREAEAEAARKAAEEEAAKRAAEIAAEEAARLAPPDVTQNGNTYTLSKGGLEVVLHDVVYYEEITEDDGYTYRVYHLATGADDVLLKNVSQEESTIYTWGGVYSAQNWDGQWNYREAGIEQEVDCPIGYTFTYTPDTVFSGENGNLNVVTEGGLTIAGIFEDIWWGDIGAYFMMDDGRISLTDYTVDGISFDDYVSGNTTPAPAKTTAYASTQTVSIDGKAVTLEAYALKDANGNPTNYVKLRDVAYALNGTAAQFEVAWDGNVNIVTDKPYTANGSEMSTPFSGDRSYSVPTAVTKINGVATDLAAIYLTDDSGGGYTYYQLRDLGRALGFNVGWIAERGIFIETDKPYTDAD